MKVTQERNNITGLIDLVTASLQSGCSDETANTLDTTTLVLDSIIQNLPVILFVKDAVGLRFLRLNHTAEIFFNAPASDFIGKSDYDFFPKEQADFFTSKDRAVLAGREVVLIEQEPIQTNRGTRYLQTRKVPILDRNGVPQFLLGISHDITDELKALESLKESEQRFDLAVRGSSDGIWDWNLRTNVVYFSPVYKAQLGYRDDEFPNVLESFAQALHPDDKDRVFQAVEHHFKTRDVYDVEFRLKTRSNEWRWIRARGQALWDEQGNAFRMAGSHTDVTEQKQNLLDLANARIRSESANIAKSEFLANMSHEIRTPINGILGMTEFVLGTDLTSEQRECMDTVKASADILLRLINDILDCSKIEAGKLTIEEVQLDVDNAIARVVDVLRIEISKKNLQFNVVRSENFPQCIIGDEVRIGQVLLNLLGNAVKFTPINGCIELRLGLSESLEEIVFAVKDTGIGISSERISVIFDAFSQADGSTTRKFGGTGLGLTVSRRIAEMMQGRIWVESEEGSGSTFYFSIPHRCCVEERMKSNSDQGLANVDQVERGRGYDGARILLVEDNKVNQMVAVRILEKLGYKVTVVENGQEALDLFTETHSPLFDLILMDCQMPVMDGYAATEKLRAFSNKAVSGLPIVALTAHVMPGDREKCLACGMDEYVAKPIDSAKLKEVIEGLLNLRRSNAS